MYGEYLHFADKKVEALGGAGDLLSLTKPVSLQAGTQTQASATSIPNY